ncbi:glycogen-binding domain-containing protein [Aquimarina sp. AU474]|uniref:glycogen-binding domain-containing protein n=1 Tax=Aquimarina sp. AU474 TaxID=2108529 RepID=UPI000D69B745|nr:glycogen-binding domain-containing protein [Aquimarina sp. AU474]
MKRNPLHIIVLLLAFVGIDTFGQTKEVKGYRIDGDELIFTFDRREYEEATTNKHGRVVDFEDLDIQTVMVSGEFNNWSMKKWRMTKVDENRYELRKKISDFTDEFSWEFKFVINNAYWAEPSKRDVNVVRARKNGTTLSTYNLKMYTAYPDKDGNVTFTLNGYEDAKKVVLSGSFNKWNEDIFRLSKTEDCWTLTLKIKPGEYQYKFIIDGKWIEDPENPNKKVNEFNGFNSVIDIRASAQFILNGYLNAKKVILSGSFNDWSENDFEMKKTKNGWLYNTMLSGGKHHYKFIVDDSWILDPDNPIKEYDGKGNINSVCMIK